MEQTQQHQIDESVYEAWKSGAPKPMEWFITKGSIRPAVITYCNIYQEYKKQREGGRNYMEAVECTAELMNTSPETVRRAIAEVG